MGARGRTSVVVLGAALGLAVAACGGDASGDDRSRPSSGGAMATTGGAIATSGGNGAIGGAPADTGGAMSGGPAAGGGGGRYAVTCDPEALDAAGRQPWMFYDQDGSDELCDCSLHADLVTEVSLDCYCSFEACPTFEVALGTPSCPSFYTVTSGCGVVAITQPGSEGPDHMLLYDAATHDLVGATIGSDVSFGHCPATAIYYSGVFSLGESCPDFARANLCDVRDCR